MGWSFSGAELPWIHPWGLVLSVHAALGDQQDRSSQDNQDGAANIQDGGADAAGSKKVKSTSYPQPFLKYFYLSFAHIVQLCGDLSLQGVCYPRILHNLHIECTLFIVFNGIQEC